MPEQKSIMDQVDTFDDILKIKGTTLNAFNKTYGKLSADTYAYEQAKLIAEVLNEGNAPDRKKGEWGYYPAFDIIEDDAVPAGFRLSFGGCDDDYSLAVLGVRLLFKNYHLARFAGTKFSHIYAVILL